MRNRAIIGVCSLLSFTALGQSTFMSADLQVWDASSGQWRDILMAVPGDTVDFRLVVAYGLATGTPAAWGGLTVNQVTISDWSPGDVISNVAGKFGPATQTLGLFGSGITGKIDRTDNPNGSIQFHQLPPDFGGDASNPIEIFTFSYTFEPGVWWRDVRFDVPGADITLAQIFTNASGGSTSVPASGRSFNGAMVELFPSPGALGLMGVWGLSACRHRRA